MRATRGPALTLGLVAAAVLLQGCPSAYQRTYEQQTQRLEAQQRATQAEEEAAHAQAQKYAAVIYFEVGSAVVDADGQRELRWFVQQMQPFPQAVIDIQGFADVTGSEATNQQLSQQRAANVASYLASQGIAPSRLVTKGFGTASPAASNATSQGRRNNRRVEVTVR
jgi:outer membrane protein OmpA-like peptidoglycan-associated protein